MADAPVELTPEALTASTELLCALVGLVQLNGETPAERIPQLVSTSRIIARALDAFAAQRIKEVREREGW